MSTRLKEVELPSGNKVSVLDDGRQFTLTRNKRGEDVIDYGNGGRVVFRKTAARADGTPVAAPATAPGLSAKQAADGIAQVFKPIIKRQNEKIAMLEARVALLEAQQR